MTGLLGQYQLALLGVVQAVDRAVVHDLHRLVAAQQVTAFQG